MYNLHQLRDYQVENNIAVRAFLLDDTQLRGQVYAPTGSGKTECFAHTVDELPQIFSNKEKLNLLIVHPRLALSQDQLARFKYIFGDTFHYTSFHSGAHILGREKIREFNTTDPDNLFSVIDATGKTHITFSSYDSLHKLAGYPFDLTICDEAHNLVQNQYSEALQKLAGKVLFYTATPIYDSLVNDILDEQNQGMSNLDLFGPVIAQVEPLRLIKPGYITAPLVHFLNTSTDQRGEGVDTTEIVAEAYKQQKDEMDKHGMPYHQMLVTTRGYGDHKKVEEELDKLWKLIGSQVDVYVIEAGESRRNGRRFADRYTTLETIKNSGRSAIIMHYDTLAEGIDINSLIGTCILRRMSQFKLLQTIGRCARPYIEDLNEKFEVKDIDYRMKPYCIVTLPVIDGVHIGGMDAGHIADAFITAGYGELTTYLDLTGEQVKLVAQQENNFELDKEDAGTAFSRIVEARLRREVARLMELGLVF